MLLYKYRQKNLFAFLTATFFIFSLCFPGLIQAQAYKFSNIVIVGNSNIETQTVESFLDLDFSRVDLIDFSIICVSGFIDSSLSCM